MRLVMRSNPPGAVRVTHGAIGQTSTTQFVYIDDKGLCSCSYSLAVSNLQFVSEAEQGGLCELFHAKCYLYCFQVHKALFTDALWYS